MQLPELVRRQLPQGTMRTHRVVVGAPRFDSPARIVETDERMLIQTFAPQSAVEALDVSILHRFAGPNELQFYTVLVRPGVERLADELRAVIRFSLS